MKEKKKYICLRDIRYLFVFALLTSFFFFILLSTLFLLHIKITFDCDYVKEKQHSATIKYVHAKTHVYTILRWIKKCRSARSRHSKNTAIFLFFNSPSFSYIYARALQIQQRKWRDICLRWYTSDERHSQQLTMSYIHEVTLFVSRL